MRAGVAGRVGVEEHREGRDPVDGPLQGCDLRQSLPAQVVVQSNAERVEGLVVIHDTLSLTNIGGHPSSLGAHRSVALLRAAFIGVARAVRCVLAVLKLWRSLILLLVRYPKLFLGELRSVSAAAAHVGRLEWSISTVCHRKVVGLESRLLVLVRRRSHASSPAQPLRCLVFTRSSTRQDGQLFKA